MNIGGYNFSGPWNVDLSFKRDFGGVYVIVDDASNVLDIGQTSSMNDRVANHDRRPCWDRNKVGTIHLYTLENGSENFRLQVESSLRSRYNPVCGVL